MRILAFALTLALVAVGGAAAQTPSLSVPPGFTIEVFAHVPQARELVALPNGDVLAGTLGSDVYIIPHAESAPATAHVFITMNDKPAHGVTFGDGTIYVGTQFGVWRIPYKSGDQKASSTPQRIATVRTSGVSRDHVTTSVAYLDKVVYASVGSSCNNCDPDLDPTRASIQMMGPGGENIRPKAIRVRNAIALAADTDAKSVWAGVAGQDELAQGHPYEALDPFTARSGTADYGWPYCYENHRSVGNHDCSGQAVPRVALPAYSTPIGAAYYSASGGGAQAFPPQWRGGLFVALHGSWHQPPVAPRVVFVPLHGDAPATAVDWNDPNAQWRTFVGGFQNQTGGRIGRPTGVAVGTQGELYVADDAAGLVYRIRPAR